jgi:protein gp37
MNPTKIEYLDFTWNPMVGCSGRNCAVYAKCWAKGQAKRQMHNCQLCYEFKPHTHFERLKQPLQVLKHSRVGVCFSADFWDDGFSIQERKQVFSTAIEAKQHWFFNLTKQPQNIPTELVFPSNWIQGVSVNKLEDLWRIARLQDTLAPFKAISFEPIFEDIGSEDINLKGISWVILGGQTRPKKMPEFDWVQNLIDCATFSSPQVPVFMKNNLNPYDSLKEIPNQLASYDESGEQK